MPYGLPVNRPLQLLVAANGSYALPETVLRIRPPAIFTQNETGSGPGAICAGLGDVIPAVSAGSAAPVSTLSRTVNPVAVTIGGQPAQVSFAGLAPGFAGLYQVNAVAPSGIAPAANVPVILSAAGASSPPVTVAL